MSPRRSSRARISQPLPAILQHTNSSSSSVSLARERSTRSNNKISSPQRSSTQRSQSIDDADGTKNGFPQTRQRQRTRDEENDQHLGEEEDDEEGDGEEEEITRCLCGQQDYPGLPPSRREALGRKGLAAGVKDENALTLTADSSDLMSDDLGSMFIQCDSCKVWQHGGCVGIMDEAMSPDEYFCEECRKDLHKIRNELNGQYSSQYLPVAPAPSAPPSRDSSQDNSRRSKDSKSRQSDSAINPKRRSTMNSRDAAYNEEEMLRRAIEESREETNSNADETAARRGKRGRSDSEAHKQVTKRPRTSSPSPAPVPKQSNPESQPVSEDESKTKAATNGAKKQRASSRGQREKETNDSEEQEAEPLEAANRKKGRLDKRKGEGTESDHEVGSQSPAKATIDEPEPSKPSPDTTVPVPELAPSRPLTRKSGRPPARRGGRVGRNQYTRDRDVNGNGADSNFMGNSPRRGQSHDTGGDSPRVSGANGAHLNGGDLGKPSKPRYMHPQRTTMNEMKRRVAGILEFISRMQVEMAVAGESPSTPTGNGERPSTAFLKSVAEQLENLMPSAASEGGESSAAVTDGEAGSSQLHKEKDFKDLSSIEMMDVLTRHLLKWQQEYGKFGER